MRFLEFQMCEKSRGRKLQEENKNIAIQPQKKIENFAEIWGGDTKKSNKDKNLPTVKNAKKEKTNDAVSPLEEKDCTLLRILFVESPFVLQQHSMGVADHTSAMCTACVASCRRLSASLSSVSVTAFCTMAWDMPLSHAMDMSCYAML